MSLNSSKAQAIDTEIHLTLNNKTTTLTIPDAKSLTAKLENAIQNAIKQREKRKTKTVDTTTSPAADTTAVYWLNPENGDTQLTIGIAVIDPDEHQPIQELEATYTKQALYRLIGNLQQAADKLA